MKHLRIDEEYRTEIQSNVFKEIMDTVKSGSLGNTENGWGIRIKDRIIETG